MNKVYFIIVNGYPRSGKDTFVKYCLDHLQDLNNGATGALYSTVDTVKEAAKVLGWDGEKTPEMRKMLSDLKDFSTKYFDLTFNEMKKQITGIKWHCNKLEIPYFYFSMIREPEEIERMVNEYKDDKDVNVITLKVDALERNKIENYSCHSDKNVEKISYNVTISNNGTEENLSNIAEDFVYYLLNNKLNNRREKLPD